MSRKEVVESVKIVIIAEDGNRMCVEGKGSAPSGMLTAFACLPEKRRVWLLEKMRAKHDAMLASKGASHA